MNCPICGEAGVDTEGYHIGKGYPHKKPSIRLADFMPNIDWVVVAWLLVAAAVVRLFYV